MASWGSQWNLVEFGVGKYRMQVVRDKIWTQNIGVRNVECGASRKQWEKRLEYCRGRGNILKGLGYM